MKTKTCPICGKEHCRRGATCSKECMIKKISETVSKIQRGRHHSEETKMKMSKSASEWQKGRHLSEETKKKLSEFFKGRPSPTKGKTPWNKGIPHSEETKRKLLERARNRSDEWRKRLSIAARNRKDDYCTSKGEKEMTAFIKSIYSGRVFENYRKLFPDKGYELDVYLPELVLAFEYNGDYHHGPRFPKRVARDFWKQEHAKDLGVQIYFIWESDWKSRRKECEDFIIQQILK